MSDPINHHYLPVFYLSQWCNLDGKVMRYYRPRHQVVASPITPENTGYEPLLYSLDGYAPEHRQAVEKTFMGPRVDGPAADALKVLLARKDPNLSEQTQADWTRFLMSMGLRDPATLAKIKADTRRSLEAKLLSEPEAYLAARGESNHPTLLAWFESHAPALLPNIGTLYLPGLIENEQIGTIIIRMRWATLDLSSSAVTLLTSDRPYIRTHGLKDPQCILVLPLSPRFAFVATHDLEQQQKLLRRGTTGLVKSINAHVVAQAVKHVYGVSNLHLRFVENRLCPPGHVQFASPLQGLPGAY
jgi:hypothetical protein